MIVCPNCERRWLYKTDRSDFEDNNITKNGKCSVCANLKNNGILHAKMITIKQARKLLEKCLKKFGARYLTSVERKAIAKRLTDEEDF